MLALYRFAVVPERTAEFLREGSAALAALAACPGYQDGQLARCLDEPRQWVLATRWESIGSYRRALGAVEVRTSAVPLLTRAEAAPSAYEALVVAAPGGQVTVHGSDLASGSRGSHD